MNKAICTLLCLFFFSYSHAQVEFYDSEAFVNEALKHIEEENYIEARSVLAKVHPSDEKYYYSCQIEMANTYLTEEKTDEAIALYKKLYEGDHFDIMPSLYVNYGSVMRNSERYEEAETIYQEAEAKYPNYSHLIFNMGISYYRSGEVQKSIDYIKRTIMINPSHSQAHYLLGVVALENGQIAEGALALLGYLADDPEDEFALNAVIKLNQKMAQNYLEEKDFIFSETGDDFSKLTLILRNQFPLNEKYKLECDIDDIYTRHAQAIAEYASEHKVKDGFFEKQYIPYLADIYKKGHIENFTYYTLTGLENFEDQIKKKEKDITSFYKEYFVDNFWHHFAVRKMPHHGKDSDVIVYCENSVPTMISEYEGRMKQGWSTFVDQYGRMTGKASIVDDQPVGIVTYYNTDGGKTEEINFEKGAKNGAQITYYDTGEKSSEWINKNDVAEGLYTTYYKDGSIYCQSTFKNDEFHGKSYCNYASGQLEFTVEYNMGKFDGKRINYYQNGNMNSTESYVKGKLNGLSEYYDIDGRKLSSVLFNDDIASGNYTVKDKAGNITLDYVVDDGEATSTEYVNGKISQVSRIKNNELEGLDFYSDGIKYTSQKFNGEEIKECIQYTRGQEKGSKANLKNHKLYDIDGNIVCHRRYKDGKLDGQNTFYYLNGNIRSEINYKDGKENGTSKFYDKKGNLKIEYLINEDLINGLYKQYKDGVLENAYNYKDGKLNGVTISYHANGKMASEGFYKDDQPLGRYNYFNSNGVLTNVDKYENGELVSSSYIERDGSKGSMIDYRKQSGKIIKEVSYSPVRFQMNLLNREFHGPYFGIDKGGDSIYVTNFVNGIREGRTRYFSGSGNVFFDGMVVNGTQHGLCKYYDDLGVLRVTSEFLNDEEYGVEKTYTQSGAIFQEYNNVKDIKQGEFKISNSQGKLLLTLYYVDDIIMKYKTMIDDDWIKSSSEKKDNNLYYENGGIALEITLNKGYIDGKYAIYDESGNQIFERNYLNGMLDGSTKYFYPNGKLYRSQEFKKDMLDGDVMYYDENEKIKLKYTQVLDEKVGSYEIYENGKLKITKIYDADELVEIK